MREVKDIPFLIFADILGIWFSVRLIFVDRLLGGELLKHWRKIFLIDLFTAFGIGVLLAFVDIIVSMVLTFAAFGFYIVADKLIKMPCSWNTALVFYSVLSAIGAVLIFKVVTTKHSVKPS